MFDSSTSGWPFTNRVARLREDHLDAPAFLRIEIYRVVRHDRTTQRNEIVVDALLHRADRHAVRRDTQAALRWSQQHHGAHGHEQESTARDRDLPDVPLVPAQHHRAIHRTQRRRGDIAAHVHIG